MVHGSEIIGQKFNSDHLQKPPEFIRRIYYALISGIGAMAICWLGYRYFPERFEAWDAVPYGVMIGLFGIGRVLDWIAKRYGLDKVEKKNEQ